MFAITTSFRGPTNSNGSPIIARCPRRRTVVDFDHNLDLIDNHIAAAEHLLWLLAKEDSSIFADAELVTGYMAGGDYAHVVVLPTKENE